MKGMERGGEGHIGSRKGSEKSLRLSLWKSLGGREYEAGFSED
jgi:hypothetical protein